MGPKNPFKQASDALGGKKPSTTTSTTRSKADAKKTADAARNAAIARADKAAAAAKKYKNASSGVAINRQAPRRQGGAAKKGH